MEPEDQPSTNAGGWQSPQVWATSDGFEGNPVRQLLVPASIFSATQQSDGVLVVGNAFGKWPAFVPGRPLSQSRLALQLPLGTAAGDEIRRATWTGPTVRSVPAEVLTTYRGALSFAGESANGRPGLRDPQLGAVLVALRLDDEGLLVKLVHCKYTHGDRPGARVNDLYQVCGQANKSVTWRRSEIFPFFKHLERRARAKRHRTGISPFLVGDERAFYRLQDAMRRYSKLPLLGISDHLARSERRQERSASPPRRVTRRLNRNAIAQLLADYQAGATTRELAKPQSVDRLTDDLAAG